MQTAMENARPIPELISDQSLSCARTIALSHGDQKLSYEELNRRADHFAGYLTQLGALSGGSVAVCMERSLDWIVAALGIMRCGAAYVPLDPAWPDSRLRFAVEDSSASFLVAREALLDRLRVKCGGIDPRSDAAAIAAAPCLARGSIEPDSLAYLIYTSGSTGIPKGVEITHANLSHLVRWHLATFKVTAQDRASHLAGLGFDAAVWEIWPNLCAGATLCLADDTVRSSPQLLQEWIVRERVTIGFVPTVHAAAMIAMEWPANTALRLLLTGGEALHRGPSVRLPFDVVNNYGPTECTVVATSTVVESGSPSPPTIGHPIMGATAYLLNEYGEQVPVGSPGEIYIGGNGVGRGYRNLPDLTGRSFLPDPFAGASDARMYRTGDRGVRRPDGEIEFCGRLDRQTKIRGQRVELDEIGSILSRHPSIDFATAMASVSKAGLNQLVAYVLPKENASAPTSHELQKHLLSRLPDYMVPAIFVRLHALPISPNGKVDLAMLPPPEEAQLLEGVASIAPASPIEEKLLAIVRQLLENDAVSARDSFFLAGGHSLLTMQLLMRLRTAFGVELSLRQLFDAPTVERLAPLVETVLEKKRLASIWKDLLGTERVLPDHDSLDLGHSPALIAAPQQRAATEFGNSNPAPESWEGQTVRQPAALMQDCAKGKPALPSGVFALQPAGTRNAVFWVHYASIELAKELGEDQPFFTVMVVAEDFAALGENPTLQRIAGCLLRKILATQSNGPYIIGGFCLGGVLAYEIARQLRAAGHDVSLLVLLDPPNPSHVHPCDSLSRKLKYGTYLLKRASRLGVRTSWQYLRARLLHYFARAAGTQSPRTEINIAQDMSAAAMSKYQPEKYDGTVLLLLAGERPPHVDFLPGWQAAITGRLCVQYFAAHHRDFEQATNMRTVAEAIGSHLAVANQEKPHFAPLRILDQLRYH